MIDSEKIVYDVWLSMALRSCSVRLWRNIDKYGSSENIYKALVNNTLEGFEPKEIKKLRETELTQAQNVINHCKNKGYEIVTYYDDIYPELLSEIYNPPLVLFCYGRLEILKAKRMLSIVGTRKPSVYSTDAAKYFASTLVNNKFVIVSGFALGIDSVAHGTAIKSGGYSIAVIGCGLDYPYPKENFNSRENFIKRGLIISEFIPEAPPESWCFPHRNRIISGISMATLVVEAGENSGSLVTANLAAEQGRDVFVIPPHDIFDKCYNGNTKLLKSGAIPAVSYSDILEEYSIVDLSKIPVSSLTHSDEAKADTEHIKVKQKSAETPQKVKPVLNESNLVKKNAPTAVLTEQVLDEKNTENSVDWAESTLDENSKIILKLLNKRDMLVDELAFETGLDMAKLYLILTELEISGFVESKAGNLYGILS